jgi:hypothetical protein
MFIELDKDITDDVEASWTFGHCVVSPLTPERVGYVANYHTVKSLICPEGMNKPFALMSRKPGLGANYLKYADEIRSKEMTFTRIDGSPYVIPRYYKEKIYNGHQRRMLSVKQREELDRKKLAARALDPDHSLHEMLRKEAYRAELKHKSNKKL